MSISVFDIVGSAGVICVLGAFIALETGYFGTNGYKYWFVNGAGALLIIVSLTNDFNLSAFALQVAWLVISARGLYRAKTKGKARED
jgi:hypothetical protein